MKNVIILTIVLTLSACSVKFHKNPPNQDRGDEFKLVLCDSISFPLDSITSNLTSASMFDLKSNSLSFLSNNYEILVFDYLTQKETCRIPTKGIDVTSYIIISYDTIFLLDYSRKSIVRINQSGKILETYPIPQTIRYSPLPVTKIAPLVVKDRKIIFTGSVSGEYLDETTENRLVTGIYDLDTRRIRYSVPYPQIYRDYNFGAGLFRWVYATYNDSLHCMVYSFPADHNIQIVGNEFSSTTEYLAGSKYVDGVNSLPKSKLSPLDSEEKIEQFARNHSYANLVYDKHEGVYYRIAEMKTIYEGMPGWKKEVSIIIINNQFRVVGETYLGGVSSTNRYVCFVNNAGLHIMKKSNEDCISFDIYKLMKV